MGLPKDEHPLSTVTRHCFGLQRFDILPKSFLQDARKNEVNRFSDNLYNRLKILAMDHSQWTAFGAMHSYVKQMLSFSVLFASVNFIYFYLIVYVYIHCTVYCCLCVYHALCYLVLWPQDWINTTTCTTSELQSWVKCVIKFGRVACVWLTLKGVREENEPLVALRKNPTYFTFADFVFVYMLVCMGARRIFFQGWARKFSSGVQTGSPVGADDRFWYINNSSTKPFTVTTNVQKHFTTFPARGRQVPVPPCPCLWAPMLVCFLVTHGVAKTH